MKLFLIFFALPLAMGKLEELYSWKSLEFDIPEGYPVNPGYKKELTFATGIHFLEDIALIATPRFSPGIPASLSWIPYGHEKSPKLQAYPDWSWHLKSANGEKNCEGITSAFRMNVDGCGNLWVVDAGKEEGVISECPPSLLVFKDHRLLKRVVLPPEVVQDDGLIINIVVYTEDSDRGCKRSKAFVADTSSPALIMYDSGTGRFKRFTHPTMLSDPNYTNFPYFDQSFDLSDGIFGLALDKKRKELFFKVFAGTSLSKVKLADFDMAESTNLPVVSLGNSSSQVAGLTFGLQRRSLVYSNVANTDLVSYSIRNGERRIAYSPEYLQYVLDIKAKGRKTVYMVSVRFQNYYTDTVNSSVINQRILKYTERR